MSLLGRQGESLYRVTPSRGPEKKQYFKESLGATLDSLLESWTCDAWVVAHLAEEENRNRGWEKSRVEWSATPVKKPEVAITVCLGRPCSSQQLQACHREKVWDLGSWILSNEPLFWNSFIYLLWLAWNSLCSPGWSHSHAQSCCFSPLSAGITEISQLVQLWTLFWFLRKLAEERGRSHAAVSAGIHVFLCVLLHVEELSHAELAHGSHSCSPDTELEEE